MRNNKMKIVMDTNIFINALVFPDKHPNTYKCVDKVFSLVNEDKVELVFSQETIGELVYNMKNKLTHHIKDEETQLERFNDVNILFFYSYSVNTENTKTVSCRDKYDIMFLKCAKQGHADYLISNDFRSGMHKIKKYKFKVLSSEKFLDIIDNVINKDTEQEVAVGKVK
jgi:putative toxin-antitoxin system toxin component, PIN family